MELAIRRKREYGRLSWTDVVLESGSCGSFKEMQVERVLARWVRTLKLLSLSTQTQCYPAVNTKASLVSIISG